MANVTMQIAARRGIFLLRKINRPQPQCCFSILHHRFYEQPLVPQYSGQHKSDYGLKLRGLPSLFTNSVFHWSSKSDKDTEVKLTLFQRFKQMYKEYWYVLLPVHLATSVVWFGGFYYLAKSGIDIVGILEYWNVSEKITNPLKDSSMGYLAVAYACYKIATPIRYTVTLGGTTISINYLKQLGYIKPIPSPQQLKEMYNERKENILESVKDKKEELRIRKDQLKDRTDNFMGEVEKSLKDKIKDSKTTFREGQERVSNLAKIKLKHKS